MRGTQTRRRGENPRTEKYNEKDITERDRQTQERRKTKTERKNKERRRGKQDT